MNGNKRELQRQLHSPLVKQAARCGGKWAGLATLRWQIYRRADGRMKLQV